MVERSYIRMVRDGGEKLHKDGTRWYIRMVRDGGEKFIVLQQMFMSSILLFIKT